jgi:FlaA1/EpsC-like NDP-sugar epimerase
VNPLLRDLDWRGFLARPRLPYPPPQALNLLRQQPILITGAGGSIGSALALRLGAIAPPKLILLEASESNLYALQRDWAEAGATSAATFVLGSVANKALLDEIFNAHAPHLVFHTAAFKHVPLMEEQPFAAIANNIFATETLTKTAAAHAARVMQLSTDKAVAPASVMGATKRVAEQIVLSSGGTAVRLGNVLASRDSVAEIFARQIAQGAPITVTDPAARRYFLTLDEAVDLLLAAAVFTGQAALFAPVLEAMHFIADLARFMALELCPEDKIAIEITGLRAGDKETEALWSASDRTKPIGLEGLLLVETAQPAEALLTSRLASLRAALDARDICDALTHLRVLVPDYTPSHAVIALASQHSQQACL